MKPIETSPLLPQNDLFPDHLSSTKRTFCNILISLLGAGVLGLPYSFKQTGWLEGGLVLATVALACYYCMMLLVWSRQRLESEGNVGEVKTYSELGFYTFGKGGQAAVDAFVLVSQGCFCIAYLIFVGENLDSVFSRSDSVSGALGSVDRLATMPNSLADLNAGAYGGASRAFQGGSSPANQWRTKEVYIWLVFPLQVLLACIRSLTNLAPFSLVADVVNVVAMVVVMTAEFSIIVGSHGQQVHAFTGLKSLPFAIGVAIYAFEGISLVLPIESCMGNRSKFGVVLGAAMTCILLLYMAFALLGYFAFGGSTKDIITLNLGNTWQMAVVKLGLCVGLLFTYPVMMHPVHEVVERRFRQGQPSVLLRSVIVLATAWIAVAVPHFSDFLSLVGSSVCCIMSFVMPGMVHLQISGWRLSSVAAGIDYLLIAFGITFGLWGTWSSLQNIMAVS